MPKQPYPLRENKYIGVFKLTVVALLPGVSIII
ncbi:uncharacterized protein METZ01_LOCUS220527 [marine metagenome]|uniref:Uncharacterized protein n=1 Tax=marine metagenome TaxID=408172 RepID=A0A382FZG4_9ZZZZ